MSFYIFYWIKPLKKILIYVHFIIKLSIYGAPIRTNVWNIYFFGFDEQNILESRFDKSNKFFPRFDKWNLLKF